MKRTFAVLGIFFATALVGMMLAGASSTNVAACSTVSQCSICDTSGNLYPFFSSLKCYPCADPTPCVVWECYRGCSYPDPVNGRCDCVRIGCWECLQPIDL